MLERTQLTGADHLDTALAAKRGVIVASGHFGNVAFSGCSEAARGVPVYVIAKDLKNKAAQKVYLEIMRRFGITRISTRRSKGAIVEALQKGAAVYMAVDQHMPCIEGFHANFWEQGIDIASPDSICARDRRAHCSLPRQHSL